MACTGGTNVPTSGGFGAVILASSGAAVGLVNGIGVGISASTRYPRAHELIVSGLVTSMPRELSGGKRVPPEISYWGETRSAPPTTAHFVPLAV